MQKDNSSDLCLPSREISYPFTIHYYTAILHNIVDIRKKQTRIQRGRLCSLWLVTVTSPSPKDGLAWKTFFSSVRLSVAHGCRTDTEYISAVCKRS